MDSAHHLPLLVGRAHSTRPYVIVQIITIMFMFIFGIMMVLFGRVSLVSCRKHPEQANMGIVRGSAYVAIACGAMQIGGGLLILLFGSR